MNPALMLLLFRLASSSGEGETHSINARLTVCPVMSGRIEVKPLLVGNVGIERKLTGRVEVTP